MKERPILFRAPMVRAVLAGRKTQTRRVAKGVCIVHERTGEALAQLDSAGPRIPCPYGQPADRLWVRETFMVEGHPADVGITREMIPRTWDQAVAAAGTVHYRADHWSQITGDGRPWTPSIYMPRRYSRITLEITGVRVQRLQDISEEDAIAEGIQSTGGGRYWIVDFDRGFVPRASAVLAYRDLWESINGPGSWDANPRVWVVEFKRLTTQQAAA